MVVINADVRGRQGQWKLGLLDLQQNVLLSNLGQTLKKFRDGKPCLMGSDPPPDGNLFSAFPEFNLF